MVHLVTVGGSFEAKVLAARLGAEGVICELRGGVDGPYPFGPVHVYVEADRADLAREVLALAEPATEPRPGRDRPPLALVLVLVAVLALAAASVAQVLLGDPRDRSPAPTQLRP